MKEVHESLHKMGGSMVEIDGLIQALQRIMPEGEAHACVACTPSAQVGQLAHYC